MTIPNWVTYCVKAKLDGENLAVMIAYQFGQIEFKNTVISAEARHKSRKIFDMRGATVN